MKCFAGALLALLPAAPAALAQPPLRDPVMLNIGFVCQWQQRCMASQRTAMKSALTYVHSQRPPVWRIELCNRNAERSRSRKDWIGFNNCVRNADLRPAPARPLKRRAGRVA